MKKITNLFITIVTLFSILSCSTEEQEIETVEFINLGGDFCSMPTDLSVELIEEDFFRSKYLLSWNASGEETAWEIYYDGGILGGKNTFTSSETEIEIFSVTDSATITIKAMCGEDAESDINTFPSLNGFDGESVAVMTANVNGINYDNLQPRSFSTLRGDVISVRYNYDDEPVSILLQGTNDTAFSLDGIEINLYINFNNWKVGFYTLYGEHEGLDLSGKSYVTFYNNADSINKYLIQESGQIEITKFDLEERIIEGNFSFNYNVYNRSSLEFLGAEKVENGTFKYSLDDEYFN